MVVVVRWLVVALQVVVLVPGRVRRYVVLVVSRVRVVKVVVVECLREYLTTLLSWRLVLAWGKSFVGG